MQGPPAYQDEGKKSGFEKRKQTKSTSFNSGSTFGFEKNWLKSLHSII